jgi:DNA-binding IclR family transcriptional regulator
MRTTSLIDLVGIETAQTLGPELDVVRAQGNVAFVRYDMDPGIGAASAAVVGPDGEAVAAVTVSGGDLDAEMRPNSHLWSLLRQVAQSISTASGAFPVMSPRE